MLHAPSKMFYKGEKVKTYFRVVLLVLLRDFNTQLGQMHKLIKSNFRVGQIILI